MNCRKWSRKKNLVKNGKTEGEFENNWGCSYLATIFFLFFGRVSRYANWRAMRLITKKYKKSSLEPDKHRSFDNLHHFRIFISEDSGFGVLHTPSIQFLYLSFSHKNSWPVEQWTKNSSLLFIGDLDYPFYIEIIPSHYNGSWNLNQSTFHALCQLLTFEFGGCHFGQARQAARPWGRKIVQKSRRWAQSHQL